MRFTGYVLPMTWAYTRQHYRSSNKTKEVQEQELEDLHKYYAPDMLRIILRMRGYYIKAAQMCAGIDMLPEAYDT